MLDHPPTLGLVLAGGRARRMGGGDKALLKIGGETILQRVLSRLRPQCAGLIINANGDLKRFESYGAPAVADDVPDFAGPLAGILAGLDWAANSAPGIEWVVSTPGDCPFLPEDFVAKLQCGARRGECAARLCALRRAPPSGGGAVAGFAARRSQARAHGGAPA